VESEDFFDDLKGKSDDVRKAAALSNSKRSKAIKLLLEFANTKQGMAAPRTVTSNS